MQVVIKDIPNTEQGHQIANRLTGGLPQRRRGRGKRVHGGVRYFQDLPVNLAERFSLYVGKNTCQKFYVRLTGESNGKPRVRLCAS